MYTRPHLEKTDLLEFVIGEADCMERNYGDTAVTDETKPRSKALNDKASQGTASIIPEIFLKICVLR